MERDHYRFGGIKGLTIIVITSFVVGLAVIWALSVLLKL